MHHPTNTCYKIKEMKPTTFVRVKIAPASTKGRGVLVCFPAGMEGRGWMAVVGAGAMSKFLGYSAREQRSLCQVGGPESSLNHGISFADVPRRSTDSPASGGSPTTSKWVSISLRFLDEEAEWKKIANNLEIARAWAVSCAEHVGESTMSCSDGVS